MSNNTHLVAFDIFTEGCLVKFDAILRLLINSHLNLQRPAPAIDTAWFKHLKMVNR